MDIKEEGDPLTHVDSKSFIVKSEKKFKPKGNFEHESSLFSYACSFCDEKFGNRNEWRKHVSNHRNITVPIKSEEKVIEKDFLSCEFCDFFTSNKLLLDDHLLKHNKLMCSRCGDAFDTIEDKRSHMIKHYKSPRCKKGCKIEFKSAFEASEHKRKTHTFKCGRRVHSPGGGGPRICYLKFENAEQLEQHELEAKKERYNAKMEAKKKMKEARTWIRTKYKCTFCEYVSDWGKGNITRHEGICKHNPEVQAKDLQQKQSKMQKCERCEEVFKGLWLLKRHYRKTGHNVNLVCGCGYKPPGDKFALMKHYFRGHTRICSASQKSVTEMQLSVNDNKSENAIQCSNIFVVF